MAVALAAITMPSVAPHHPRSQFPFISAQSGASCSGSYYFSPSGAMRSKTDIPAVTAYSSPSLPPMSSPSSSSSSSSSHVGRTSNTALPSPLSLTSGSASQLQHSRFERDRSERDVDDSSPELASTITTIVAPVWPTLGLDDVTMLTTTNAAYGRVRPPLSSATNMATLAALQQAAAVSGVGVHRSAADVDRSAAAASSFGGWTWASPDMGDDNGDDDCGEYVASHHDQPVLRFLPEYCTTSAADKERERTNAAAHKSQQRRAVAAAGSYGDPLASAAVAPSSSTPSSSSSNWMNDPVLLHQSGEWWRCCQRSGKLIERHITQQNGPNVNADQAMIHSPESSDLSRCQSFASPPMLSLVSLASLRMLASMMMQHGDFALLQHHAASVQSPSSSGDSPAIPPMLQSTASRLSLDVVRQCLTCIQRHGCMVSVGNALTLPAFHATLCQWARLWTKHDNGNGNANSHDDDAVRPDPALLASFLHKLLTAMSEDQPSSSLSSPSSSARSRRFKRLPRFLSRALEDACTTAWKEVEVESARLHWIECQEMSARSARAANSVRMRKSMSTSALSSSRSLASSTLSPRLKQLASPRNSPRFTVDESNLLRHSTSSSSEVSTARTGRTSSSSSRAGSTARPSRRRRKKKKATNGTIKRRTDKKSARKDGDSDSVSGVETFRTDDSAHTNKSVQSDENDVEDEDDDDDLSEHEDGEDDENEEDDEVPGLLSDDACEKDEDETNRQQCGTQKDTVSSLRLPAASQSPPLLPSQHANASTVHTMAASVSSAGSNGMHPSATTSKYLSGVDIRRSARAELELEQKDGGYSNIVGSSPAANRTQHRRSLQPNSSSPASYAQPMQAGPDEKDNDTASVREGQRSSDVRNNLHTASTSCTTPSTGVSASARSTYSCTSSDASSGRNMDTSPSLPHTLSTSLLLPTKRCGPTGLGQVYPTVHPKAKRHVVTVIDHELPHAHAHAHVHPHPSSTPPVSGSALSGLASNVTPASTRGPSMQHAASTALLMHPSHASGEGDGSGSGSGSGRMPTRKMGAHTNSSGMKPSASTPPVRSHNVGNTMHMHSSPSVHGSHAPTTSTPASHTAPPSTQSGFKQLLAESTPWMETDTTAASSPSSQRFSPSSSAMRTQLSSRRTNPHSYSYSSSKVGGYTYGTIHLSQRTLAPSSSAVHINHRKLNGRSSGMTRGVIKDWRAAERANHQPNKSSAFDLSIGLGVHVPFDSAALRASAYPFDVGLVGRKI